MILAIDTYYTTDVAKTVGVLFNDWRDTKADSVIINYRYTEVAHYIPGEFYKRELPCILGLTNILDLSRIDTIIVDGFVDLKHKDYSIGPGLGRYLWEALGRKIEVVGIAKTNYGLTDQISDNILRGKGSTKPLYVQSSTHNNMSVGEKVRNMYGENRLPYLLKLLDRETKKEEGA